MGGGRPDSNDQSAMITVVMVQARRRATHRFVIMGNWLSPRPFCHDHAAMPPGRGSGRLPVSACICRRGSYSGITNTTKLGAPGIRGRPQQAVPLSTGNFSMPL